MNVGGLLSGAGVVGRAWRQEEDAQRQSRMLQLQTQEQNRVDRLRQEMLQAPMPQTFQMPQFDPNGGILPVHDVTPPPAPPAAGLQLPVAEGETQPPAAGVQPQARPYQDVGGYTLPEGMTGAQGLAALRDERMRRFADPKQAAIDSATLPSAPLSPAPAQPPAAQPPATQPQTDLRPLFRAMVQIESSGRPEAVSRKGATGLMQVMPDTAMNPGFGLPNVFDFAQQQGVQVRRRTRAEAERLLKTEEIGGPYGEAYMRAMLNRYNNNVSVALAAYNAGPGRVDRWLAEGADFSKLPAETQDYVKKVLTEMGAAPAAGLAPPGVQATEPIEIRGNSRSYLANPQSIPLDMQRAMQQRAEIERLAQMYQRAGMGPQFMEARAKLIELDNGMTYLHGMQGLQELELANDPRRLAAVWSQYAGVPIGIQRRTDGNWNIIVNGERTRENLTAAEISNLARRSFDQTYREQQATESAEFARLQFQEQLKMVREIFVERAKGDTQMAVEMLKQNQYQVRPAGAGSEAVIIIPPGGGAPFVFNPSGTSVTFRGRTVQSYSAIPIPGLSR